MFCFTVSFSLAEKKMAFRAKDRAIREKIKLLRANHIARITSDFKMDLINTGTSCLAKTVPINTVVRNMLFIILSKLFRFMKGLLLCDLLQPKGKG